MRTRLPLLALAALAPAAYAQDVAQKVSFSAKATSVKSVLSMLEKATSVPLVVNPQLAEERLIISVKDRPLKETLDRIAEAVSGSWIPERGGFRLVRTQANLQQLAAAALKARTELVKAALSKQFEEAQKNTILTPAQAKARAEQMAKHRQELMDELSRQQGSTRFFTNANPEPHSPATGALAKLLSAIGADALARLPVGSRTVYAVTPTRSQLALPGSASAIVREFDAANALYAEAVQSMPQDNTPGRPLILDANSPEAIRKGPTTEVHVQIQVFGPNSISAIVWFINQAGDVFSEGVVGLSTDSGPTAVPASLPESSEAIPFSEDAITHAKLLANSPPGAGRGLRVISRGGTAMIAISGGPPSPPAARPEVTARWKKILSEPEANDPLSFAAAEAVLGVAERYGDNVVANLPDEAIMTFARTGGEPLSAQRFWSAMTATLRVVADRTDGWLTIKPSDPLRTEASRLNRAAAQRFYAPLAAGGQPGLDLLAAFIATTTLSAPPSSVSETLGLISAGSRGVYEAAVRDAAAYQLFATLSAQDKERLSRGASVPLMNLTPAQQNLARHLLFNSQMGPISMVNRNAGVVESRTVAMRAGGGISFGGLGRLADERTEFLANGLPMQASFTLTIEREDAVEASSSTSEDMQMMTAQELSMLRRMGQARTDGGAVIGITPPNYDRFRLGSIRRFVLTLSQPDVFELTRLLDDPQVGGRILGYDELPSDFRRRVEAAEGPRPPTS